MMGDNQMSLTHLRVVAFQVYGRLHTQTPLTAGALLVFEIFAQISSQTFLYWFQMVLGTHLHDVKLLGMPVLYCPEQVISHL